MQSKIGLIDHATTLLMRIYQGLFNSKTGDDKKIKPKGLDSALTQVEQIS